MSLDYVCIDHLSHLKVIKLLREKYEQLQEEYICTFAYKCDIVFQEKKEAEAVFDHAK